MNPGMSNYEAVASRDLPLSNAVSELRVAEGLADRVHDRASFGPDSKTIPYWSLWANEASSPDAIVGGVAALRAQSGYTFEQQ